MSTTRDSVPNTVFLDTLSHVETAVPHEAAEEASYWLYDFAKRTIDLIGASVILAVAWPVMLGVALSIRMSSPGPVIFRQRRPGVGGKLFWCYKFRTMVIDAEERLKNNSDLREAFEQNFKLKNDPRLTPVGNLLRKTSLDELPQLFNVIQGSMSLIGPRPILTSQMASYLAHGEKVFTVKPGLGGYWQVYGRSNTSHAERVRLDLYYVDNRSTALDIKLIVLTAVTVIKGHGAY